MYFFYEEPVVNSMNTTNLEYIKIFDLFGINNIELNFDKEVNIYVGENGLGKTTILNCVYYILKKKYDKLAEIDFSRIELKLKSCEEVFSISIADVNKFNSKRMSRHSHFESDVVNSILNDIFEMYYHNGFEIYDNDFENKVDFATRKLSHYIHVPMSMSREMVLEFIHTGRVRGDRLNEGSYKNVERLNKALDISIEQRILYFTTYRRIENDFSQVFRKNDNFLDNEMLIRFGMSDVEKSIDNILHLIRENSRESFNKMTSVLLKQYASTAKRHKANLVTTKIDKDMLKIIFDRLGNEIADTDCRNIFSLLDNGEIYNSNYAYLLDLINKLIENYNEQKIYDEKIKNFAKTCNKYLNGKQFVYNQSDLKLEIKLLNTKKDKTIALSKLSSGEKQIVSLFSKLYLENEQDSILIIDEPELSISMKWQRMLLPDIMRSGNCKMLLTVTHSPFIFENEFDEDARDMYNCITYSIGG